MGPGLQATINVYEMNSKYFRKALEGISYPNLFLGCSPQSNPLLWIAGHVAISRGHLLNGLGASYAVPWQELFGRGSKLKEPKSYPGIDEVVELWAKYSGALLTSLSGLTADRLAEPNITGYPSSDKTVRGTIEAFLFHECYHIGQMGYICKWITSRPLLEN